MTAPLPSVATAVGGGKGGVGKSLLTIALAYWLGRLRQRVILADGDFGGANLHTMLGLRIPALTVEDFLSRKVDTLEEVLVPTALDNVQLLAGGHEIPALGHLNYGQKMRFLRALFRLPCDHLLLDLGAGSHINVLDFFLAAPRKIVVTTPQPTAVQNAYGFLKAAVYRQVGRALRNSPMQGVLDAAPGASSGPMPESMDEVLEEIVVRAPDRLEAVKAALDEFRPNIVVNMAHSATQVSVGRVMGEVSSRFLGIRTQTLGAVPIDPEIDRWAAKMDPGGFAGGKNSSALRAVYEIAYALTSSSAAARAA